MLLLSAFGVSLGNLTFSVHTAIAGSLLTIVGFQIGTLGLFSTIAGNPIKTPSERITHWITDTLRLEHGLTFGITLTALGSLYSAAMVSHWLSTGHVPLVVPNLLAFTVIILGMQTIFNAFFLSILADKSSGAQ